VAFQVAVQHVVAWRQVQGQGLAVVDVKAPYVVDSVDALGLIVDRQPVALQRQLAWVMVGSYDVDLVGGRAMIEDAEADGAGGHNSRVLLDLEVLEFQVHGGAARRGLLPAGHREWDRDRECGQHKREGPRPAPPRPSPRHPVYLLQVARGGSRGIAMNVWWMQRMSNIELVLGGTTADTRPIGRGRRNSCGSIAP
jgi:hypothetical protein